MKYLVSVYIASMCIHTSWCIWILASMVNTMVYISGLLGQCIGSLLSDILVMMCILSLGLMLGIWSPCLCSVFRAYADSQCCQAQRVFQYGLFRCPLSFVSKICLVTEVAQASSTWAAWARFWYLVIQALSAAEEQVELKHLLELRARAKPEQRLVQKHWENLA